MGGQGDVTRLDASLASLAREETALRLRVGQALEVLSQGGIFELGFSSLAAYVLERCDRSVRWAEAARCLSRRVGELPGLRRAMAIGSISWSMGELLARVARPADEAYWLEAAESRTVRQMRVLVAKAVAMQRAADANPMQGCAASTLASAPPPAIMEGTQADEAARMSGALEEACAAGEGVHTCGAECTHEGSAYEGHEADADAGREACTLSRCVPQEDAWLFESTRLLLEQLGVRGSDAQVEALLAEGQGTLLAALPEGTLDLERLESGRIAQQLWVRELARWRVEAEVLCEERVARLMSAYRLHGAQFAPTHANAAHGEGIMVGESGERGGLRDEPTPTAVAVAAARGAASLEGLGCAELDAHVRELSRALARHELELSRLVLRFHRAEGWRRQGYATETQYARERLGWSLSSLRARRALALRLEALPRVAAALGSGQIGVEAALQVVRVATPRTQAAWVERARRRTVKHLREEVAAALVAVRHSGELGCAPPADAELAAYHELEQAVVSGHACGRASAPVAGGEPAGAVPTGAAGEVVAGEAVVGEAVVGEAVDEAVVGEAVDEAANDAVGRGVAEPICEERRAWFVMLASLARWLENGLQMSAAVPGPGAPEGPAMSAASAHDGVGSSGVGSSGAARSGRVTLRLRMSPSTRAWWRALEAQVRRWLPRGMSWLRFLCLTTWQAWRHVVGAGGAYSRIYVRDRYRCLSPVCSRRDVTPHHLRFRSAGGGDEPANIGSLCTWCHLWGVHGGRIRATGTAELIHWELGAPGSPCLVVHGRERLAA